VIRQSYVKDGKVVIPPAGLYWDVRVHLGHPMLADPVLILGKVYYLVDTGNSEVVKRSFTAKNGDLVPFGDGSHALQVSVSTTFFPNIPDVTFKILKPSGNLFGAAFGPVTTNQWAHPYSNISNGSQLKEGIDSQDSDSYQPKYYGENVVSQELTYVVVSDVTTDTVTVREFATGGLDWVEFSPNKPTQAMLGVGDTMDLGKYRAKVMDIDSANKTLQVRLETPDGTKVTEKTLGPLTDQVLSTLPSSPEKETLILKNDDVQVQLDAFREPFKGDQVSLLGYTGVFRHGNAATWKDDPRFVFRPDT
jgi:hypothetical protein